jgi:hypothetical protein
MSRVHANNFSTTLNGAINNSVTSIIVTSATGFPSVGAGVTCNITVQESSTVEIMKVTAISGTTLTVVRGQEGSGASSFSDGATVEIRFTRDSVDTKQDTLSALSISTATVATGDKVLIQDVSDSDNLKTVTTQAIANLAPAPAESAVTFTDITTNNASTSKHGYLKKLSNTATEYMDGTGNWSVPAGGGGGSSGLVLLDVKTASASSSLSFDNTLITSTYTNYMIVIQSLMTSSSTTVKMGISVDNGATDPLDWYNMCSIDVPSINGTGGSSTVTGYGAARESCYNLNPTSATHTSGGIASSGVIWVNNPASALCNFVWDLSMSKTGGYQQRVTGSGNNISGYTPPINYIKFYPNAGNFASGTISLYGLQKV